MTGRRNIGFAILPILLMMGVTNGIYIMGSQLTMMGVILSEGPMDLATLLVSMQYYLTSQDAVMAYSAIGGVICLVIFVYWYKKLLNGPGVKVLEIGRESRSRKILYTAIGIVLVAVGAQFVGAFLVEILGSMFPEWITMYEETMETIGLDVTGATAIPVLLVVYSGIVAPIVEELCLRGICMTYALRALPGWGAIIFSSLLFGLLHGNILQGIFTFIFALVLGYIFLKTRRVLITILIHIVFNTVSLLGAQFIVMGTSPLSNFLILFASLAVTYLGIKMITTERG